MPRKTFYLPDRQIEAIEDEAEKLGLTLSDMMRRIVDEYFTTEESHE